MRGYQSISVGATILSRVRELHPGQRTKSRSFGRYVWWLIPIVAGLYALAVFPLGMASVALNSTPYDLEAESAASLRGVVGNVQARTEAPSALHPQGASPSALVPVVPIVATLPTGTRRCARSAPPGWYAEKCAANIGSRETHRDH